MIFPALSAQFATLALRFQAFSPKSVSKSYLRNT